MAVQRKLTDDEKKSIRLRSDRKGKGFYTYTNEDERIEARLRLKYKTRMDYKVRWKEALLHINDIGEVPPCVSPRIRSRCRYDLLLFLKVCFPEVFHLDWGEDQIELVHHLEHKILHGGLKAVAMPRGSGKTSICHGAVCWMIAYGHRKFIYFIRDDQPSAESSLEIIRTEWEMNDSLFALYPEIAYPIRRAGKSYHKVRNQTYIGKSTHMLWKKSEARFPALHNFEYDPFDDPAGVMIRTSGITGSIRGALYKHPISGKNTRPDFILLDDVQTDRAASSPTTVNKLIDIIDGAVKGLSAPGKMISGAMPCTITRPNDLSATYLDRINKPIWNGSTYSMVISWPPGITDEEITDKTESSRAWQEYSSLRLNSLRAYGDISLATTYYKEHRDIMDRNFRVSWECRYVQEKEALGNVEVSAQQHAMNLRLENITTFSAEYQNRPVTLNMGLVHMPALDTLCEKQIHTARFVIPQTTNHIVAMIDVQDEMLWYTVCAMEHDYTGVICDYGVWPKYLNSYSSHSQFMTRQKAATLKQLSYAYWDENINQYNEHLSQYGTLNLRHFPKAPFEGKMYHALHTICNHLLKNTHYMLDSSPQDKAGSEREIPISYLAIDCKWGESADIIKRFITEYDDNRLVPYEGVYIGPTSRQMSEYQRGKGNYFEDELHKDLPVSRWVAKYDPGASYRRMLSDVNRWKTFLVNRLNTSRGLPGSLSLFKAPPEQHLMIATHLCKSEYPEAITARNRTIFEWKVAGAGIDNDLFDCAVGCMAIASLAGCHLRSDTGDMKSQEESQDSPGVGSIPRERKHQQAHQKTKRRRVKASEALARKKQMNRESRIMPR